MLALNARQRRPVIRSTQSGFSLIELLVVIAMVAVLAMLAAPNVRQIAANQALSNATSDLFAAILNARSAAIKRGRSVVIQPNNANDWASGWTVYVDLNNNGAYDAGTDDFVDTREAISGSVTSLTAITSVCTGNNVAPRTSFSYNSSGFLTAGNNGFVRFLAASTSRQRCIVVNTAGRARICEPGSNSNGC
jgi:type IV fimbrial biogenesis protein FimT